MVLAAPDHLLSGHAGAVWAVTFSRDGRYLASGSDDGVIVLWDGESFERVVTLRGPTDRIRSLSFSHDTDLLAGAALSSPTVVWDISKLRQSLREMQLDW
jgi:WD40 repeat protein